MTDRRPLHQRCAELLAIPDHVFLPDVAIEAMKAIVDMRVAAHNVSTGDVFVEGPPKPAPRVVVNFEPRRRSS